MGACSPLRSLARDPVLRREALALALFRLADFGPWVAILVFAYDQGGATAAGLVSLGLLAPTALFAPFGGPLIDRHGASRALLGGYVVQAALTAATAVSMLAGAPAGITYTLAALTTMALTVTLPAHAVISPGIARTTEQLVAFNAVTGWILSLGLVAAPALAGLMLALASPGAVYVAGAVCLAAAALLVLPLRSLAPPLPVDEGLPAAGMARQLEQGAVALSRSSASREVVIVFAATFLMIGAFDVLAVALALGTLDIGGSGAGYLTAMHGAGAVVGAACSYLLIGRSRLVPVILGAALVVALAFALLGLRTTLVLAFAVAAVSGFARSLLEVAGQTLLQRVTPTALLARVFALKEGLTMAACGIGSVLVPVFVALAGIRGALLAAGAIAPFVVLLRLRPLLRVDAAAEVPVVTVALLRSLDVFRALPVPALEGVAHTSATISVPAGSVIVREGEPGDRYYAIADGSVEVRREGELVRTLGRGEGFGEIALLHATTRTASVSAVPETTLVAIEREAFLVAVTGHGGTRQRVEGVAAARLLADTT
jgi:MFS family permease